ncbi:MAG: hypothetical protein AAFS10_23675 [Myxococcota bacterium]
MSDNTAMDRVEALTFKLLDRGLEEAEQTELDTLLDADGEARQRHLSLMEQESLLRGERQGLDLSGQTMARLREVLAAAAVEGGVMETIKKAAQQAYTPVEPLWRWWLSGRFWGGALALAAFRCLHFGACAFDR